MAELEFDVSDEPPKKKKAKENVAGWMVALTVVTFLFFTASLAFLVLERMHHRGQLPNETDPHSAHVLLP